MDKYLQQTFETYSLLYKQWFKAVKELRKGKTTKQRIELRKLVVSSYKIKKDGLQTLHEAILGEKI